MSGRPLTAEQRDTIVRLTRGHAPARVIAEQLGVTIRTVVRHRAALGVARPAPRRYTAAEVGLARRLLEDGASYREVATTLGRDPNYLAALLPGFGLRGGEVPMAYLRSRYPALMAEVEARDSGLRRAS